MLIVDPAALASADRVGGVKVTIVALAAVAVLALTGCSVSVNTGSSSGPSEEEVADLLREHNVYTPECVKSTGSSSRDFNCTGESENSTVPLTLKVTVAESGNTVVITHCEAPKEKSIYGAEDSCGEVR